MVEELMPNAQVVADRFHIMTQINQELDGRRKPEKRQAEKIKNKQKKEEILQEEPKFLTIITKKY